MKLRIQSGDSGQSREIELPAGGALTLGRSAKSDVALDDEAVSRSHAKLTLSGGKVFIEDLGSSGGTFLNDKRIDSVMPFTPADKVRIGGHELTLVEEDAVTSAGGVGEAQATMLTMAPGGSGDPNMTQMTIARPSAGGDVHANFKGAMLLCTDEMIALKERIHTRVLSLVTPEGGQADGRILVADAERALDQTLREMSHELPETVPTATLRQALMDELVGYGPISPMLRSKEVTEVMVNGPERIFVEIGGKLVETGVRFASEQHLAKVIQRIVEPLGRHVDEASPMVDARLPDGSRVNAIIPPLALDGSSLTIRKFAEKKLTTDDLIRFGSMTKEMALFLEEAVKARQNILVSGGTGSGKTTLLNILSQFIPENERVVTVEDSAELKLSHRDIVRLEARPPNSEGKGRVTIRDLVINCLRMRPDRIIVGECRGAEALDMLQAMNTGHDGSLTTAHANNPRDAVSRLENMVMMAGFELPSKAIREQIASAINIIVQQTRLGDGSRKIVKIVEVTGRENDVIQMQDIFEFRQTGVGPKGEVLGEYSATGNIPFFIEEQRRRNKLTLDMSVFVPKV